MKKLLLALLLSAVSFVGLSAFDDISELKAAYAIIQKLAGQIQPNKTDEMIKLQWLNSLVIKGKSQQSASSEMSDLYKQVNGRLNTITPSQWSLVQRAVSKALPTTRCQNEVKEEMRKFIRAQEPANAESIIANSKLLSEQPQAHQATILSISRESNATAASASASAAPLLRPIGYEGQAAIPAVTAAIPAVTVEDVTDFDAYEHSAKRTVSFDEVARSFPTDRFVPQDVDALYGPCPGEDSAATPAADAVAAGAASSASSANQSSSSKWLRSLAAAALSGASYAASKAEVCKQNPSYAKVAQGAAIISALYSIGNGIFGK